MGKRYTSVIVLIICVILPFCISVLGYWISPELADSPKFWTSLVSEIVVICTGVILCRLNRLIALLQDKNQNYAEK